jgi:hypothetical protein
MLLDHDLSEDTRVLDQVPGNLAVGRKAPQTWGKSSADLRRTF